jgi:hypothetical protein
MESHEESSGWTRSECLKRAELAEKYATHAAVEMARILLLELAQRWRESAERARDG